MTSKSLQMQLWIKINYKGNSFTVIMIKFRKMAYGKISTKMSKKIFERFTDSLRKK